MHLLTNGLLLITWLAVHVSTIAWLIGKIEAKPDESLLLLPVLAAVGFTFSKMRIQRRRAVARSPLMLFTVVAALSLLNAATIAFDQLQVTFFLLGIFAWLGLQASTRFTWQKSLNVAVLIALAVPFYLEFHSGLGFGVRLATASLVEQALHLLGFPALSSHDVIITENAIAHVDIPCSGLKSLWVGSAFYLAALVLMGIRITGSVVWKYLAFMTLLLSANTLRILILTLLTSVYGLPKMAQMLHVPLGILGFTLSCLAGWWLLKLAPTEHATVLKLREVHPRGWLIGLFALFLLLPLTHRNDAPETITRSIMLPTNMQAAPVPLTPGEERYFSGGKTTTAQKWHFRWHDANGSVLIVRSRDFNMFHAPELCMAAGGIAVDTMRSLPVGRHHIRLMSLAQGSATGLYWLQSDDRVTDDFASRYWQYVIENKRQWSMISMVLNAAYPPDPAVIEGLIERMVTMQKG